VAAAVVVCNGASGFVTGLLSTNFTDVSSQFHTIAMCIIVDLTLVGTC
jgi:hypothetical protein